MVAKKDWICSRIAALFWAGLVAHTVFGILEVGTLAWRWAAAGWLFVCLHSFLEVRYEHWMEYRRAGVWPEPLWRKMARILIGGWVGAISWITALAAIGTGWLVGKVFDEEAWGLAIGLVVAKITYIPWLLGILWEARRQAAPEKEPERTLPESRPAPGAERS